jgi:molybdopterin converting factor small subunit
MMPVTVRFPSMLHARVGREVLIHDQVANITALMQALDRQFPGLERELSDHIFNVAINDEMLLHGVSARQLQDGDVVEFVPTIAGGDD